MNLGVAGVVLTGGASRRMGADKALVEVDGTPMARRVAGALAAGGCAPVWCQGGDAARLTAAGLTVRPDSHPGDGPLPAIYDALRYHAGAPDASGVVVAACDLPDLDGASVGALVAARSARAPVALAVDGHAQLVSWWPAAVAGRLGELIDGGMRAYRDALAALDADTVPAGRAAVHNINTPQELAERPTEGGPPLR